MLGEGGWFSRDESSVRSERAFSSILSMEEAPPTVEQPHALCQVCGVPLMNPKRYQIHKIDHGYSLGGQPFVLPSLPANPEGHACHKCYQANLKARVRKHIDRDYDFDSFTTRNRCEQVHKGQIKFWQSSFGAISRFFAFSSLLS